MSTHILKKIVDVYIEPLYLLKSSNSVTCLKLKLFVFWGYREIFESTMMDT